MGLDTKAEQLADEARELEIFKDVTLLGLRTRVADGSEFCPGSVAHIARVGRTFQ